MDVKFPWVVKLTRSRKAEYTFYRLTYNDRVGKYCMQVWRRSNRPPNGARWIDDELVYFDVHTRGEAARILKAARRGIA